LEDFGISQRDEISFVEYLSKPNERLEWKANSLPDDVLCQENAVIMTRFNRFPLVIDPSGQATEFLLSQFKSRRMNKTSFVDPSFLKTLESALRFGTGLIVQDVENIDPILNPVLNREVQITGGRRLVRVGDQEIDFSPSFAMFMTTRDPSHQFSPDLCSRVTFSNFTVTSASLEAQCLSRVLRSKRPDIDEKRKTLLKLQGEYQARLRDLEDSLLNALSVAKGNILDDDNVMIKLETLKKEASEVQKEVQRTGEIMKEVEEISNVYKEFSKACSKIYFGMKRLSELHFLYHFSLNFFNDIVSHVLSTVKEDSVKILLEALFLTSYRRVSQGLLVRDHLVFALFLARVRLNLSDGNEDDVKKLHSVLESKNLGKTRDFVHKVFGDHFLDQSVTLSTFVSEVSNSRSPLLLCSTKGFDASTYVTRLATETKARLTSVSMGSAEGYTMADKSIDKAVSSGNWVMLRNVHLCPSWLKKLEKRLYTMSPRDSFRLFLTAEINISIPANLARISQVKVFEAPNGIKASLRRTLGAISEDRMNRTPAERSRLYFLLAWFHAVVLERRRFCPVGWTKSYVFFLNLFHPHSYHTHTLTQVRIRRQRSKMLSGCHRLLDRSVCFRKDSCGPKQDSMASNSDRSGRNDVRRTYR
jgi:dynein heavy chain 1, cytosolic